MGSIKDGETLQGCKRRPELFFSDDTEDIQAAKFMCSGCSIKEQADCFKQGLGADIIAHRNGVTPGFGIYAAMTPEERQPYVERWVKRHDKEQRTERTKWTPEMLSAATERLSQGLSYASIAAELGAGISGEAVRLRLKRQRSIANI